MSLSTTLMMLLSLSISAIFWSTSCCFSLYTKSSLLTSLRTESRSATLFVLSWCSTVRALSFAVLSFCRISISFCRMPIFSFISAAACCDVWIMLTALFRSFFTTSYSFVYSRSCCARLKLRLLRSRITMSLTFISSSASRRLCTALAYSLALASRRAERSKVSRSSDSVCCERRDSSSSSSLFSLRRELSAAALSFSRLSSWRKSLMNMSMSLFSSSSRLNWSLFSLCCICSVFLQSSPWNLRLGSIPCSTAMAASPFLKALISSSFPRIARWCASCDRFSSSISPLMSTSCCKASSCI
mmetsp:Transcript_33489/g.65317  ORF Transcript_33489/g.65317 Transcript_33489/m.65317 type:complete len:300 (-) Transcript_33489:877-1776(-)